jgi:hypothetical protein
MRGLELLLARKSSRFHYLVLGDERISTALVEENAYWQNPQARQTEIKIRARHAGYR